MAAEWLSPVGAAVAIVSAIVGGLVAFVAGIVRQDRRLEKKAEGAALDAMRDILRAEIGSTADDLRSEAKALERMFTSTASEVGHLSSLAQTRDGCANWRTQQSKEINEHGRRIDVLTEQVRTVIAANEDSKLLLRAVDDLVRVTAELRVEIAALKRGSGK